MSACYTYLLGVSIEGEGRKEMAGFAVLRHYLATAILSCAYALLLEFQRSHPLARRRRCAFLRENRSLLVPWYRKYACFRSSIDIAATARRQRSRAAAVREMLISSARMASLSHAHRRRKRTARGFCIGQMRVTSCTSALTACARRRTWRKNVLSSQPSGGRRHVSA